MISFLQRQLEAYRNEARQLPYDLPYDRSGSESFLSDPDSDRESELSEPASLSDVCKEVASESKPPEDDSILDGLMKSPSLDFAQKSEPNQPQR